MLTPSWKVGAERWKSIKNSSLCTEYICACNLWKHRSRPPAKVEGFPAVEAPCAMAIWNSYLVDSASSHMLVSKIKPCMSKYKQLYTVKLRMAH